MPYKTAGMSLTQDLLHLMQLNISDKTGATLTKRKFLSVEIQVQCDSH